MHMAGAALAIHALVSLILLSTALAHCLPGVAHHPAGDRHLAADHAHPGGHHDHGPAAPEPQDPQDDCCGILCRSIAGHAFAPAPDPTRIATLSYATRHARAPDERLVVTRPESLLPLGSRAPPVA